ncbi:MAG: glycine zipper 2TM domain-containing protein [Pseudomonadota bacterium]
MKITWVSRALIKAAFLTLPILLFAPVAQALCNECGTVTNVRTVKIEGTGSGAGVVAGGILGGVLGNQVGGGSGKDLATVGGVVGGAYVGNQAEKKSKETTQYRVSVKLENGKSRTFKFSSPTSYRIGDKVVVSNGSITRQ